jgi:hypothetical protein
MAVQVLNKVLFGEECLLFAGRPFTTHWCQRCLRNICRLFIAERPTSVSLKKKKTLPEVFALAES